LKNSHASILRRGWCIHRPFLAGFDGIDFTVHRQVSEGNLVFNEPTDTMRRKDGTAIPLPVTGVFEIRNDRIAAWRDYFDMGTITKAFS
jgi:limonene-1,2-epoxide hydrolase